MPRQRLVVAERVVEVHPDAQPRPAVEALRQRQQEGERLHQVRRDPQQRLALAQVHAHQAEVGGGEVAQAAVDEPGRARGGAAAEIVLLDQRDLQAAQRRVARDAAADDPAADDDDGGSPARRRARPRTWISAGPVRRCPRQGLAKAGVATWACGRDMVDMTMTVLAVAGG